MSCANPQLKIVLNTQLTENRQTVNDFSKPLDKDFPRKHKHDTHRTKPFPDSFQQSKGKIPTTDEISISRNSSQPAILDFSPT